MRHKDVELCPRFALALYLSYRFEITREFEEMELEDWLDNSKWFDIKVLVNCHGGDPRKQMGGDAYTKQLKEMLKDLGIVCKKYKHLGRHLGARFLELLEAEMEEIRALGNWNPSIQEKHYSGKMPMGPIRKMGGFSSGKGIHHNIRTTLETDDSLRRMTSIGRWCYDAREFVLDAINNHGSPNWTAYNFLDFMCILNEGLVQDAASMMILLPDRADHPVFRMECFLSPEFQVSDVGSSYNVYATVN
jgi:hypothetical protein